MPAILATNGFGGSKSDFDTLAPSYAKRGYAFLAYSGLGFGNSGCKITLDDPDWDGKAGKQLLSFLGGTKAAPRTGRRSTSSSRTAPGDPRVGMIGGSYGGQIQFAIAGIDRGSTRSSRRSPGTTSPTRSARTTPTSSAA